MKKTLALTAVLLLLVVSMGPGIADTHGQNETPDIVSQVTGETTSAEPPPPPPFLPPANKKPNADAGPIQKSWTNRTVYFNGSKSEDLDGTIVSYEWDFGDGAIASGVAVEHEYSESGQYNVTLTVRDDRWSYDSDTCKIKVSDPPTDVSAEFAERVRERERHVVDAMDEANTVVTLNTTDDVTVTVLRYEDNPYPGDPIPASAIPNYVDVEVSDPDAVVWPIYVEIYYHRWDVEEIDESSLGIYYWMDGAWQRCSDTGVDTENNVVWAYMTAEEASGSPILIGGITSLKPAEFVVSYLKIEPRQIELGGTVTISVYVTNVGETPGSYNVTLNVEEGLIISVKEVTLQGGESEIVEFEFVPEAEGTYDVDIEGMIGSIYVIIPIPVPPLPPYLSNLTVTPTEIELGDNVTISLDIRDMHNQSFTYIVTMKIDQLTLLIDVELEPYEFKTVSQTITPEMIGEYHVWVQGLTGSFTVKAPPKPAEFVVSDLEVDHERVAKGKAVTITVEVENIGDKEGTHTVLLDVDGLVTELAEVTLDGGESTTVTFTITEAAGDHTVRVEDLPGDFTVTAPPFWIQPVYLAGILIIVIAAGVIIFIRRPWSSWTKLEPGK